jgi:hypothetical protein
MRQAAGGRCNGTATASGLVQVRQCPQLGRKRLGSFACADFRRERPKQLRDAVGVVAHQRPVGGKNRVPVSRANKDSAHLQHPPGAIEDFLNRSFTMDHARVQLVQDFAHFLHPGKQLRMGDEIRVESLQRRARESDWCDWNDRRDCIEH